MSAETLRRAASGLRGEWDGPKPMGTAWHRERDLHLALADWLDQEASAAERFDLFDCHPSDLNSTSKHALSVARAYLGEA